MSREIPLIRVYPWENICQEASTLSVDRYIPCASQAQTIVYHARDHRGYYMCLPCAIHNLRNRSGKLVSAETEELYKQLLEEEK